MKIQAVSLSMLSLAATAVMAQPLETHRLNPVAASVKSQFKAPIKSSNAKLSKPKNLHQHKHDHQEGADDVSHICQTDENGQDWQLLQKQLTRQLTDPAFQKQRKQQLAEAKAQRAKQSKLSSKTSTLASADGDLAIDGRYYIPVVFHIYGQQFNCDDANRDCLTEEKIIDALNRTNEDFQGLSTDVEPISPQFAAIRENLNIEFVLAKKTPDGQPTNGIVNYNREQKGYGENTESFETLIKADAWDNYKYMNIYIMNDLHDTGATNNSGIAWYPQVSMSDEGLARVVYNGAFLGDNTDENQRSIFTHEFGHWLNLAHTFEGKSCSLAAEVFCGLSGDRSCDTPQMSLPQAMQKNAENCLGQPTNTENFMHYTNNYAMYTEDQVKRMTAALHGPSRSTLWSNDNLAATGLEAYISNSDRPWDGVSGIDTVPEGELLAHHTGISGVKGERDTFSVQVPENTQALAFYLDGFEHDPDMYVSHGVAPTPPQTEGGEWVADQISFAAPGSVEFVGVMNPDSTSPYFATVDAFTDYANANLHVVAVDDTSLSAGQKRFTLIEQKGMWATEGGQTPQYQFNIPADAEQVSFVLAGTYQGDPDIHIKRNGPVSIESYDCRPFSAPKLAEYCEFDQGGTYNVMIDPFKAYSDVTFHVYYVTSNQGNQVPFANANGPYAEIADAAIDFSSEYSNDVDGQITSYLWDFGDGNTSTAANPSHSFDAIGDFQVSLTVTDNEGLSTTVNTEANITVTHPDDANLCDGCTRVYLNDETELSALEGSTPSTYQFDVPVAASLVMFELSGSYTGDPDIHVGQNSAVTLEDYDCRPWESPGTKETCLFTSGGQFNIMINPFLDYSGVRFKAYYDIIDTTNGDTLAASINASNGVINTGISFSSNGSTGSIASYAWDFGDGSSATQANPTHSYTQLGTYDVSLTVTNDQGATASKTEQVLVSLPAVEDACAADNSHSTSRDLVEGEAKCITGSKIFAVSLRGKSSVSLSLVNAPADAQIYFKEGGWPSISRGIHDVVSSSQGDQQCVTYDIASNASHWGYLEISGAAEGASIVVDYDVPGCRHAE